MADGYSRGCWRRWGHNTLRRSSRVAIELVEMAYRGIGVSRYGFSTSLEPYSTRTGFGRRAALLSHQLHQPPLDRRQYPRQIMPALEHRAGLGHQRPQALAVAKRRPLLDTELGPLGGAAEGGEHRGVAA